MSKLSFYDAWWFLCTHRHFNNNHLERINFFEDNLDIEVVKVNPETDRIEDDESLNTKVQVWLECGGYYEDEETKLPIPSYDPRFDCGGDTFEEAIINLAELVRKYEGDGTYTAVEENEYEAHCEKSLEEFEDFFKKLMRETDGRTRIIEIIELGNES
jgi:hypothetical protein